MSTAAAIPNPFVYGRVLVPGKPFCSRPQLESSVLEAATHQQRIVLLGERRMGKSSLVEHAIISVIYVYMLRVTLGCQPGDILEFVPESISGFEQLRKAS